MPNLIPREEAFFTLLEAAARNVLLAARDLRNLFENYRDVPARVQEIRDKEHEGDRLTHELLDMVDRTFVTPLEREDIHLLARGLDDICDATLLVADRMLLYRIEEPTRESISLVRILVRCCEEIDVAMPLLRSKRQIREAHSHCVEIDRLEDMGDRVARDALMKLFEDPGDVMEVLKWKEFYDALEEAIDHTENVADLLRGVVLKSI